MSDDERLAERRYLGIAQLKVEGQPSTLFHGEPAAIRADDPIPRVLEGEGYRITLPDSELGDTMVLSSGRSVYANCGIVGIDPDGNVSEGYDGGLAPDGEGDFTEDERRELAAYMVSRWREWGKLA